MEFLINLTRVLGMIALCVFCILFLLAVVTTPYRQRKSKKKIENLANSIMQELTEESGDLDRFGLCG